MEVHCITDNSVRVRRQLVATSRRVERRLDDVQLDMLDLLERRHALAGIGGVDIALVAVGADLGLLSKNADALAKRFKS